jgi:quinoprotein glucose dehydrogenase
MRASLSAVLVALAFGAGSVGAQRGPADVEWRHYSGDNGSTKYSPLAQITKDNITRLRIAWRRPQLDPSLLAINPRLRPGNNFRSTPIMVGGMLYASNGVGLVEAFDPASGRTAWVQQVPETELASGSANRGVAYWAQGANARILTFRGQFLYALHPRTGKPLDGFGDGGRVNLTTATGATRAYSWNGTPLVVRDVVVLGSSMAEQDSAPRMTGVPGDVYGFDVRTGRLRWTFHVIPRAGEPVSRRGTTSRGVTPAPPTCGRR